MDQVLSFRHVKKSRKEKLCFGCLEKIPVGSRAHICNGIYEGDFYTIPHCNRCHLIALELPSEITDEGLSEGWFKYGNYLE